MVRAILESNIKLRDKAEERFQSFFEREIHQLHNSVRTETEVRITYLFLRIIYHLQFFIVYSVIVTIFLLYFYCAVFTILFFTIFKTSCHNILYLCLHIIFFLLCLHTINYQSIIYSSFIFFLILFNRTYVLQFSLQIREREDDEIVEALNRYTIKLQNSLQIINSTEM